MCSLVKQLALLALFIHSCFAIECYICDSSKNPKCAHLPDKNIQPEKCTVDKLDITTNSKSQSTSWLMTLSDLHYYQTDTNAEVPMVCQKLIGIDEVNHQNITVRRCQLEHVDPCNFAKKNEDIHRKFIEHCSICNSNGCNGGLITKPNESIIFGLFIFLISYIFYTTQIKQLKNQQHVSTQLHL